MHFRRRRSFLQKMSMIILRNTKTLFGSGQFSFDCPAETEVCIQWEKNPFSISKENLRESFQGETPQNDQNTRFPPKCTFTIEWKHKICCNLHSQNIFFVLPRPKRSFFISPNDILDFTSSENCSSKCIYSSFRAFPQLSLKLKLTSLNIRYSVK